MYFFSHAEGHVDEAVLDLNVMDCNVLSLQQDSVNSLFFVSFLNLDKGLSDVSGPVMLLNIQ